MAITIGSSETGKFSFDIDDVKKIDDMIASGNTTDAVNYASKVAGIDPKVGRTLIWVESGFKPDAKSYAGAYGLGQLMPDTAKGLGVEISDPAQNLLGGLVYYKGMLNATGGDYVQAYKGYMSGNPKISDEQLDSFHSQGVKNFTDKLASLGITGKADTTSSSSSSSTADNSTQAILEKFANERLNIANTYGPAMANLISESNKIIEENKSKLNNIYNDIVSKQTDYSNKLKKPPTYDEVSKPKNGLQEFFKTFLPVALSLAAAISPGKYGYRVALASSLWNSLKENDIANYKIALSDWKNQMEALKEETQAKITALQTKAQMIQNDMTLDLKSKQSELASLQNQEKEAYTALKNSEELYEKLAALNSTNAYRNAMIQLGAQKNQIEQKKLEIEAAKAGHSNGGKSSGATGSTTYTFGTLIQGKDSKDNPIIKIGHKNEVSITNNIHSILSNSTGRAAIDLLNIINNTKDYPTYQDILDNWYNEQDPNNTTDMRYVRNVLIQAIKQDSASMGIGVSDDTAGKVAYGALNDLMYKGIDKNMISGALEKHFILHVLIPHYQNGLLPGLSANDDASVKKLIEVFSSLGNADFFTSGSFSPGSVPTGDAPDNSGNSGNSGKSDSVDNSYKAYEGD
jgi:hypothetical protein